MNTKTGSEKAIELIDVSISLDKSQRQRQKRDNNAVAGINPNSHLLLNNINLSIEHATITAIVGPNGAGKSTLISALAGDYRFSGEYRLLGKPYSKWKREALATHMAVLLQDTHLSFPFSAREVVALGRLPHNDTKQQRDETVSRALSMVSACGLSNRSYPTLSGGEQQRVQLARVIAQLLNPTTTELRPSNKNITENKLLLLDEPTAHFDLAYQQLLIQLTRSLAKEGVTVVLALHDLNIVLQYADKVLVIDQGNQIAIGKPYDVLTSNLIFQVFNVDAKLIENSPNRPYLSLFNNSIKASK